MQRRNKRVEERGEYLLLLLCGYLQESTEPNELSSAGNRTWVDVGKKESGGGGLYCRYVQ